MAPYVPSYANPFPVYQPAMRVIAGITNSNPVVVTTTFAHQYINGLIVRIDIPVNQGMQQLNQQTGSIVVLSPTTFSMPIDSTNFTPFSLPTFPPNQHQDACVVPIGEENLLLRGATQNVLPY